MVDTKRLERAVATATQYQQDCIAGLDDAMTRRLIASTVFTESNGGDLTITNKQGYVGRYQAGAGWLADAGFVDKEKLAKAMARNRNEWGWAASGGMTKFLQDPSNWNEGLTLEKYKQSSALQDQAFKRNSDAAYERAIKEGVLHLGDNPDRIAGFLKARHIAGYGGAKAVLQGKPPRSDSNGTSNYDYYNDIVHNRDGLDSRMLPSASIGADSNQQADPSTPHPQPPAHHTPTSRLELRQGNHSPRVHDLQQILSRLGYRDLHGRPLAVDGDFGRNTDHAVRTFQREHGLHVDGVAGRATLAVIDAIQANPFTSRYHPHHALYEQSLQQVHAEESRRRIHAGPHSEALAGALTVAAAQRGMTRIDRVELNDTGLLVRAVQVSPVRDEPGLNRTTDPVSTRQAMHTPLLQSSEQAQQMAATQQRHQDLPQHVQPHPSPSLGM